MAKQEIISSINSYLGDGLIDLPANAPSSLSYNDVSLEELRRWINTLKESLESLTTSNYLKVIPENVLNSIKTGLENARNQATNIGNTEGTVQQNTFNDLVGAIEQLVGQVSQYLNISDLNNYRDLQNKTQSLIDSTKEDIDKQKKENQRLNSSIIRISNKADSLLGKVDSGVLDKELEDLSKSKWHVGILVFAVLVAVISSWILIDRTHEFANAITQYVTDPKSKINWAVYTAKWLASVPFLVILIFALIEIKRRVALIDQFVFRSKIAKSLEGYRLLLLSDEDLLKEDADKSQLRLQVNQFMIAAILELINSPTGKEKSSVALRIKDLFELKAKSE